MRADLGGVDMIHWQGRRLAPEQRARRRAARVALIFAIVAAVSLAAGFYSGLPVPIGLLQLVSALVLAAVLAFGAWTVISAVAHRGERSRPGRR
jgi:heme A synthase